MCGRYRLQGLTVFSPFWRNAHVLQINAVLVAIRVIANASNKCHAKLHDEITSNLDQTTANIWYSQDLMLIKLVARSSPQWRSGRSTTAHIVLDIRSLIWDFGESCTIVHGITSVPISFQLPHISYRFLELYS